jgi:gluconate kinase
MSRTRANIVSSLLKKGFRKEQCPHHDIYHYYVDGKFTHIHTFISRGSKYKDYSDSLLAKMRKQLKLDNKSDLLDLIDCPMLEEQYREVLRDKGFL